MVKPKEARGFDEEGVMRHCIKCQKEFIVTEATDKVTGDEVPIPPNVICGSCVQIALQDLATLRRERDEFQDVATLLADRVRPGGKFIELALSTGKLVQQKNAAYGDSVRNAAKIMQILYPNGISHAQIPTALVTVRILDKLSRIANDPKFGGEDPAQDITGYGLLLQDLVKNGL